MLTRPVFAATLCLLFAASAWGQPPLPGGANVPPVSATPATGYLQFGLVGLVRPQGTPYPRVHPTVHGISPGALVSGGVWVSQNVAFEVEAWLERTLTTPMTLGAAFGSFTATQFVGELRDMSLSANIRMRPSAAYPVELQLGGGLAVSRYADGPSAVQEANLRHPVVGVGVSIPLRTRSRIAVVPAAGYRLVNRPGFLTGPGPVQFLGASKHGFYAGVTARAQFRRTP